MGEGGEGTYMYREQGKDQSQEAWGCPHRMSRAAGDEGQGAGERSEGNSWGIGGSGAQGSQESWARPSQGWEGC